MAALLSLVADGWSGKPAPVVHQLILLPFTAGYAWLVVQLFSYRDVRPKTAESLGLPGGWSIPLVLFGLGSALFLLAENLHFRSFGYHIRPRGALLACLLASVGWVLFLLIRTGAGLFAAVMLTYSVGVLLSIWSFPINYLRSDMLPVIDWADLRLLHHLNPYGTMHVGTRLYDFPYLPGMLVAFWPAVALGLDLRVAGYLYLAVSAGVIWWMASPSRRFEVAAVLGLFLLCPFLQYRHDLYLQPHWFLLTLAVVVMGRGRYVWAAVVWGVSCAVYQFSWILVPFVVLNGYRRKGFVEALKLILAIVAGGLVLAAPFLSSAWSRISNNTVGQWGRLPHALADPINVSYWLTYLVRPDKLKWIQATVLVCLFAFCWFTARCRTLEDTLRWMCCALAVFIPLNVIVDGYFYLTLLLLSLLFVCVANGWWRPIRDSARNELALNAQTLTEAAAQS